MRAHPLRTLLAPALTATLAACGSGPKASPVAVVESVYSRELTGHMMGLPTEGQARLIAPFLGDSLNKLLDVARGIRDSAFRKHPDEVPPWADGDLFTSLFEGPTSFYALAPIRKGSTKVPVRFERSGNGTPVVWVDTMLMGVRNGNWVIEDVLYGGTWAFAPKGTLRAQLHR